MIKEPRSAAEGVPEVHATALALSQRQAAAEAASGGVGGVRPGRYFGLNKLEDSSISSSRLPSCFGWSIECHLSLL